ncbi:MAG: tRNA threonylcarbamoyladenosine dehydratase [Pseudomonadota bacterium]
MDASDWQARFGGIERVYGAHAADRIRSLSLCVVGLGGVGSWAAEALVRTGVARIRLVDLDDVCVSNTNRQSHALGGTVGQFKAEVLAARLRDIHPGCDVEALIDFATQDNLDTVLAAPLDGVLDCIDSVVAKSDLLAWCRRAKLPVVSTGGAGGRLDPTRIEIADLNTVRGDALSARVRSRLRHRYGYSRNPKRRYGIPTVFSGEPVRHQHADGEARQGRPASGQLASGLPVDGAGGRLDCAGALGATSMVTASFGFAAAAELLRRLTAQTRPASAR